jgi:predicted SnoaL-like aldol condensation-catalyzing enzyme
LRARWFEIFNNHDLDAVPEIIADTYWNYGTTTLKGVDAGRAVITQADGYSPDRQIKIIEMAARENVVFALLSVSGTHTGSVMGIAPSNRTFSCYVVDFFRFDDHGKMTEGWVVGRGDVKLALEALRPIEPAEVMERDEIGH